MTTKIFKLNDYDFIAARDLEEAKQCLADTCGEGKVDAAFIEDYIDDPYEIPDAALDELKIVEEEYEDEDDLDAEGEPKTKGGEVKTFREELAEQLTAGRKVPFHFAAVDA